MALDKITPEVDQEAALKHLELSLANAAQVQDLPTDTPTRAIQEVGVVGAGTMGVGIAVNFLDAGLPVTLLERERAALDRGIDMVRKIYQASVKRGRLTEAETEKRLSRLNGTLEYGDLAKVDLVIEAVFEDIKVKQSVFRELDRVCKSGAILASNSSTLDLDVIAAATQRPWDVIGLHFFSPANVMPLLEVIRGRDTSAEVIATSMQLAGTIRKNAVLVGVCFGYVGNRMLEPYAREAGRLVLEGASPAQVDRVITELGFPMGPFAMGDLAGLDISCSIRANFPQITRGDPSYGIISDRLVALGRLGQKTGRGTYIYKQGSRTPQLDLEVLEIARREAEQLGIQQREIGDQEVLERCLYSLINEGAQILDEGIAQCAGDIDVIWVKGYGFPPSLGGPMYYADRIGVDRIYNTLCQYRDSLGQYGKQWFEPSPLLKEIAERRGSLTANPQVKSR
jgi:3-hydroxyacyl-CoA dehydrogenase